MRLAITIGRIGDKWTVLGDPAEAQTHKELFRAIRAAGGKHGKAEFHEVRTFSTDGAVNYRQIYDSDAQKQAHAARVAADTKKFEAAQKQRAEAAKKPAAKPAAPAPVKKEAKP